MNSPFLACETDTYFRFVVCSTVHIVCLSFCGVGGLLNYNPSPFSKITIMLSVSWPAIALINLRRNFRLPWKKMLINRILTLFISLEMPKPERRQNAANYNCRPY